MLTFLGWAAAVCLTACTVFMLWLLHRTFQYVYVEVSPVQINDDDSVVSNFIELLDEARTSMILYDDGNDIAGSMYNDTRVIDAVHSKLRHNPDFELRCLFNCDDAVEFRKQFADEPQVEIRTRTDMDSDGRTHYKIIDGGLKAYLSRHCLGSRQRQSKTVDCSNVSKRHRRRVAEFVLSRYTMDFAMAFKAAKG